jgi:hypothetical protein
VAGKSIIGVFAMAWLILGIAGILEIAFAICM